MMQKVIKISGAAVLYLGREVIEREIWYQTRDMDTIISIQEMARTGDGHKFIVTGIPQAA